MLLLSSDFFSKLTIFQYTLSESQAVWIQFRADARSVLIWVQTVCKGYQLRPLSDAKPHHMNVMKIVKSSYYSRFPAYKFSP